MADDRDNPGGPGTPAPNLLAYPTLGVGCGQKVSFTSPSCLTGWRASSDGRLGEVGWRSPRGSFGQCAAPTLR